MSNIIFYLIILSIPLFIVPTLHFIANSIDLSSILFIDGISGLIVFILPMFFYFSAANNKTFLNKEALSLKINYLKEIFLLVAFTGTSIGLSGIWARFGIGQRSVEFTGDMWMTLGLSIGVCIVTDLYGVLGYLSSLITENILVRKLELEKKITTKYKSNTYLTIGLLIIPIIIFISLILFVLVIQEVSISNYFDTYDQIFLSLFTVLIIITGFIIGNDIKIIFKSIFNKSLDIVEINSAIKSIRALCRILPIICGILFLAALVLISFTFGSESFFNALSINFSMVSASFTVILLYVLILRTFLLKLNLELVELNHITIDSDKYFIFKYCIPLYISIHIGSGFAFLIMIFK